jgi:iron(III) transport system substrate-binding protein
MLNKYRPINLLLGGTKVKNKKQIKSKIITPNRRGFLKVGLSAGVALGLFSIGGKALAKGSGKVTLYTSMPSKYSNAAVKVFNELKTGVNVDLFYAPTYQVLQRVEAEMSADRLIADLMLIADPGPYLSMKKRNELLDYVTPHIDMYPDGQKDEDGLWVNGRTIATIFAYNHNIISASDAPKTWQDFADPKWAGKLGGLDVRVGGTGYSWYYITRNHPDLGVRWWKELAKTKMVLTRGHGALMDRMVSGELPITEQLDYYVWTKVTKNKAPVTPVYPTEIIPITMAPISILRRGPNNEGAKVFFDWWLSKEGQETIADINGIYSPRSDVAPLPGKPPFESLKTMKIDLQDYSDAREALQKEYAEIFNL